MPSSKQGAPSLGTALACPFRLLGLFHEFFVLAQLVLTRLNSSHLNLSLVFPITLLGSFQACSISCLIDSRAISAALCSAFGGSQCGKWHNPNDPNSPRGPSALCCKPGGSKAGAPWRTRRRNFASEARDQPTFVDPTPLATQIPAP